MKIKNWYGTLALLCIFIVQACEEEEEINPCPEPSFQLVTGTGPDSLETYVATADFEGMEDVSFDWYLNDSLVETETIDSQRDFTFSFRVSPNDSVNVCLRINSNSCTAEFCLPVLGKGDDGEEEETECPVLSFKATEDPENVYLFEADFAGKENTQYTWLLDSVEVGSENFPGDQTDHKFYWQFAPGEYQVCIVTEDNSCGYRESCQTIIAERPDSCPDLFFETEEISSRNYKFTADFDGIDTLTWYGWFINGEYIEEEGTMNNGDNMLDYVFDSVGVYEVCIMTETPGCPAGISYCQTIEADFCRPMSFTSVKSPDAPAYTFTADFEERDALDYEWAVFENGDYLGGETREAGSSDDHEFYWQFQTGVDYVVCLRQVNPECENFQSCEEILIP